MKSVPYETKDTQPKALPGQDEVHPYRPIHQWHVSDRPREKLAAGGIRNLSDSELIALIFGNGTTTKSGSLSALQLGQQLLNEYKTLGGLSHRSLKELTGMKGIGIAKASQLLAAFEIGKRVEAEIPEELPKITGPEDVARIYGPRMRDLPVEIFRVVLLNSSNRVMGDKEIHRGGLAASLVDVREVFRHALLEKATGIICMHNHPSGNLEPSREDIKVTQKLVEAGKIMDVRVHDHLIIAGRSFTSFANRGLI
ncbi:MAG TPA: DNA repair protein RadC [Rhodothermales bacterium]|nr:DNA repair protein RadC [Rhodothermales bacterium]